MKKLITCCLFGLLSVIFATTTYALTFSITEDANNSSAAVANYQFMSHLATAPNVQCLGTEPFAASTYHPAGNDASPLNVMAYIKTVPIEFKSIYYWNINVGTDCLGAKLVGTNKSVTFSSSKAYESWIRAIVKEDLTVLGDAASSAYFRVKKADATLVVLARTKADGTVGSDDTYTVSGEVTFAGADKRFEIRLGSVNSGSVQPSLVGTSDTYPLSVSSFCTKAQIIYSFKTNKVTIREIDVATAIQQAKEDELSVTTYPNPTNGKVSVNASQKMDEIQLINLIGQTIKTVDVKSLTSYNLNLQNIENGIYMLRIKMGTLVQNKMIVVKK
ncbi:MAG: T9SS type A sorting domain-containing protein [Bacteroidales bacterium]